MEITGEAVGRTGHALSVEVVEVAVILTWVAGAIVVVVVGDAVSAKGELETDGAGSGTELTEIGTLCVVVVVSIDARQAGIGITIQTILTRLHTIDRSTLQHVATQLEARLTGETELLITACTVRVGLVTG